MVSAIVKVYRDAMVTQKMKSLVLPWLVGNGGCREERALLIGL